MAGGVHVPDELIEDILLRVPAKALVGFKAASKKWYSLLSDTKFADFHLKLKRSSSPSSENLIFFQKYVGRPIFESVDIETRASRKFNFPLEIEKCVLIGSANGLVCVAPLCKGGCFIWNPSTGECKKISVPLRTAANSILGFGYDSYSDDYKVVANWGFYFRVFSLKANSWKKFEYSFPLRTKALHFKEALHWCYGSCVVSFEFATEQMSYMELPEEVNPSGHQLVYLWFSLQVYQGLLCVSGGNSVWVMKEDGNIRSWIKLGSLAMGDAKLVGFSNLGEVVYLRYDESRIIKSTIEGEVSLMMDVTARDAFAYTESLISPRCFDSQPESQKMMKKPRKQRKTNAT